MRRRAVWTVALLLAGCRTPPVDAGWWNRLPTTVALSPEFLAAVPAGVAGVHGDQHPSAWLPGDRLVFGLEAFDGDGVVHRWLVEFEVLGPDPNLPPSPHLYYTARMVTRAPRPDGSEVVQHHVGSVPAAPRRVRARATELDGRELFAAESTVADGMFQLGLHRYCASYPWPAALATGAHDGDGSEARPFQHELEDPMWCCVLVQHLFDTFQANQAMASVLRDLADTPGLFDVLGMALSGRYGIDIGSGQTALPRVPVPAGVPSTATEAFAFPVRITVGGSAVLLANLLAVPPDGPLALTAGIVAMAGQRPSDPRRRFALLLLGVHRTAA